jgi:hypothetical protein
MKIVENDANRLVLRSNPYFQIIIGMILALTGLVITFFFGRSVELHCERAGTEQITCQLTQKLLDFQPLGKRTVSNIQGAEVVESRDSDGDSTYKVVFITANGRLPLTNFSSSEYSAKANLSRQINDFISRPRQNSLDTQVNMEWWILIILFAFSGGGILVILLAKTVVIEMVRTEGVMRIIKDGLFGSGQEDLILRDIEDVELESSHSSQGSTTYRIAFHIHDGRNVFLTRYFTSGRKNKQAAVDAMKNFLSDL